MKSTASNQDPNEKDYFQVTDELAMENSHFVLSEALLSVVEQVSSCTLQQYDYCSEKMLNLALHK